MSVFDNPEFQDILNESFGNDDMLLLANINYPIGSIVAYSKSLNKYMFFSPDNEFDMVLNDYIAVGIVLELLDDLSYIVMYKGFLNQDKIDLLDNLNIRSMVGKDKNRYIASIILNDFNRYVKIYKNNCKYNLLKNTEMLLPSNRHMDLIMYNTSIIIENLSKLIGDDKTEVFYKKLISERIYCNISGHVAEWKIPRGDATNFYREPTIIGGYFLPIIHITGT